MIVRPTPVPASFNGFRDAKTLRRAHFCGFVHFPWQLSRAPTWWSHAASVRSLHALTALTGRSMGGFAATPIRRRLVLGGRAPLSAVTTNVRSDEDLGVDGAGDGLSSPCATNQRVHEHVGVKDEGLSGLFLTSGASAKFPTSELFTPVTKKLAGGRHRIEYFKVRASLGASVSELSATARHAFSKPITSRFNATGPLPTPHGTPSWEEDATSVDSRASIKRGEKLHAALVKAGELPAPPRLTRLQSRPARSARRARQPSGRSRNGVFPGLGAAASSDPGRSSSPATGWKLARQAAARAAAAFEDHQRQTDAATVIQMLWRKKKRIERLRNVFRLTCLLARYDRMERAAAGETVEGMTQETLREARAQAALVEAKLEAEAAEDRRRAMEALAGTRGKRGERPNERRLRAVAGAARQRSNASRLKPAEERLRKALEDGPAAELDDIFDEWAEARALAREYRTPRKVPPRRSRGSEDPDRPVGAEVAEAKPIKTEMAVGTWEGLGRRLRVKDLRRIREAETRRLEEAKGTLGRQKPKEKLAWGGGRPADADKKNRFKAAAMAAKGIAAAQAAKARKDRIDARAVTPPPQGTPKKETDDMTRRPSSVDSPLRLRHSLGLPDLVGGGGGRVLGFGGGGREPSKSRLSATVAASGECQSWGFQRDADADVGKAGAWLPRI